MYEKHILGLDLGTNSIGWAVINALRSEDGAEVMEKILCAGSRIIPMDAAVLGDFDRGNTKSQTAERTARRMMRRLNERAHLRRERLHRVLSIIGFLPEHYANQLDRYGKFINHGEPKLPWKTDAQGHIHFLFQQSFNEMLADFQQNQPDWYSTGRKVPYDWTIYYLRKKALTQRIEKEELAWVLLNFNQKRGYYQLREDSEEEKSSKVRQYFDSQIVKDVIETGEAYRGLKVFCVVLEDGTKGKVFLKDKLDWVGQKKDILVSVDLDKNGHDKYDENGMLMARFKVPTEQEWETQWKLVKAKTENDLVRSKKTVGEYIYDTLLRLPGQKVRGKLVRTIERKYYKDELREILEKQREFHSELRDRALYEACMAELYPQNDAHRNLVSTRDFVYLLLDDILFYQRPLKSKKSLIANCPYEKHDCMDRKTGEVKSYHVKCIAKSHPLFQEFRLWQFLSNLRIYRKEQVSEGKTHFDVDVTHEFLKDENDYVSLFDWLNCQKSIKQEAFLKYPPFGLKKNIKEYRWNYVEDKVYSCNETRAFILEYLAKADMKADFLTREMEEALWHLLYSISDKQELRKALGTFAQKYGLNEKFVEVFRNAPPFEKDYGAYSLKAIKKLLPLMRMGKYWSEENIDTQTRQRIARILSGECDDSIRLRVREKAIHLQGVSSFRGLPLWLACYVVYDRHSEVEDTLKWKQPADIDGYLAGFKQHSLHNPIVEQVILETLRTVRDIWKQVGRIDEIHVELGREMKNPKDKREKMARQMQENENANLRIKVMLMEFMNPEFEIENVRPYSPAQQDLLRIYEAGVWDSVGNDIPDDIRIIINRLSESDEQKRPTTSEVLRYKLWLEQKYCSPYTGRMIPLGKLFTPAYEIEHVIPQSRYFDDSFSNKVICEAEVNRLKGNMLGHEFISRHHGEKVLLSGGGCVEIFSLAGYEKFVKEHYAVNPVKQKKLFMDDIPEQFIARQLNDSRYISKLVKSLLSNIVREDNEQEDVSKNLIVCTGGVTDRLKKDWGINDVWNRIILPRFLRMNQLEGKNMFTTSTTDGMLIPIVPLDLQKGFSKKRIDHRHHAMDAIVIACANRNIVNYLNNESASKNAKIARYDLQRLLCDKQKTDDKGNYRWFVRKPWATFTQDVYATLQNIVVSFKQNLRVINKTTNHYQHYVDGKKTFVLQEKGDSWAIRKSMHNDTFYGEVNLRMTKTVSLKEALKNPKAIVEKDLKKKLLELLLHKQNEKQIKAYFDAHKDIWRDIDLKKIEVYYFTSETKDRYYASRKPLDDSFDEKKIQSVTDTCIRKILLCHLEANGNNPKQAFSPEGIELLNRNMEVLNNGKPHQPVYKVRTYEKAGKFAVGQTGNKASKYVEADKGTNLFFAVYETSDVDKTTGEVVKKRTYKTIPLNVVIDRQKRGLPSASEDENGNPPCFVLSPNDLVYVPTSEEVESGHLVYPLDRARIYKMVSCTGNEAHFIPAFVSNPIVQVKELGSNNKAQRAWSGEMIKEICIPVKVDRLGNIIQPL